MRVQPAAFTVNEWRLEADKESLGEDGEVFIVMPGVMAVQGATEIPTPEQIAAQNQPSTPGGPDNTNRSIDTRSFADIPPPTNAEVASKIVARIRHKVGKK